MTDGLQPPSLPFAAVATLRVHELGHVMTPGMPVSPNHPAFQFALLRRHGDVVRPDGGSAANEVIVTGGHVGTHLDALGHVSQNGRLHGGLEAAAVQGSGGLTALGIETIAPIVCRALLLDVLAVRGAVLGPGDEVTPRDLDQAVELAGSEPRPGDALLLRTGWSRYWDDPPRFLGQRDGAPGPGEEAAAWLAQWRPILVGAETAALEVIRPGAGHRTLPVHRVLIVEHGIHLLEAMDLNSMSEARAFESLFICLPLRIAGATGSPVRPVALAP